MTASNGPTIPPPAPRAVAVRAVGASGGFGTIGIIGYLGARALIPPDQIGHLSLEESAALREALSITCGGIITGGFGLAIAWARGHLRLPANGPPTEGQ